MYQAPTSQSHPNWFRAFMWSNIVSGGHATYGGTQTWLPHTGSCSSTSCQGVWPYRTAVRAGALKDGARDFPHIARFFATAGPMAGLVPNTAMCGKCVECGLRERRLLCACAHAPAHDHPAPASSCACASARFAVCVLCVSLCVSLHPMHLRSSSVPCALLCGSLRVCDSAA